MLEICRQPKATTPGTRAGLFTGDPCVQCQGTVRYRSNGGCVACNQARKKAKVQANVQAYRNRQQPK